MNTIPLVFTLLCLIFTQIRLLNRQWVWIFGASLIEKIYLYIRFRADWSEYLHTSKDYEVIADIFVFFLSLFVQVILYLVLVRLVKGVHGEVEPEVVKERKKKNK